MTKVVPQEYLPETQRLMGSRKVMPSELVPTGSEGYRMKDQSSKGSKKIVPLGPPDPELNIADDARVHPIVEKQELRHRRPEKDPVRADVDATKQCETWLRRLKTFGGVAQRLDEICLFVERLQVLGILWECSQQWPWPAVWLQWTQWVVVMNLDFAALGKNGAGKGSTNGLGRSVYGQMPHYLIWVGTPIVFLAFVLLVLEKKLLSEEVIIEVARRDAHTNTFLHPAKWSFRRMIATGLVARLQLWLYTPTMMVLVRLYRCEAFSKRSNNDGLRFAVDQQFDCYDPYVHMFRLILTPLALAVLYLLPSRLFRRSEDACEYEHPIDHEKTLQSAELDHLLGVDDGDPTALDRETFFLFHQDEDDDDEKQEDHRDDAPPPVVVNDRRSRVTGRGESDWVAAELWLIAPFRRHAAAYEAWCLVRKAVLVLLCWGLLGGKNTPRTQGVSLFVFTVIWGLYWLWMPPYRVFTTNVMFVLTEISGAATAVYAMLTAWGLRSASVMPKQQTYGLFAVNGFVTACVVVIVILEQCQRTCCRRRKKRPMHPSARSLFLAVQRHGAENVVSWVSAARTARAAALRTRAWQPVECAPIDLIEHLLADVRILWLDAKRRDTIFEITLRKSLDELFGAHQYAANNVLLLSKDTWLPERKSLFPNDHTKIKQRNIDLVLMRPSKRVLLLKLLALRHFQLAAKASNKKRNSVAAENPLHLREPPIVVVEHSDAEDFSPPPSPQYVPQQYIIAPAPSRRTVDEDDEPWFDHRSQDGSSTNDIEEGNEDVAPVPAPVVPPFAFPHPPTRLH